jgi:uncharacterized membrane protein
MIHFLLYVIAVVLLSVVAWVCLVFVAALVSATFDAVRGVVRQHRKERTNVSRP